MFLFPRKSVQYTQDTMEEALRKVKLMRADLGGTEILAPLQNIYSAASIPGHPLQVRTGAEPGRGDCTLHASAALSSCGLLECGVHGRGSCHVARRRRPGRFLGSVVLSSMLWPEESDVLCAEPQRPQVKRAGEGWDVQSSQQTT